MKRFLHQAPPGCGRTGGWRRFQFARRHLAEDEDGVVLILTTLLFPLLLILLAFTVEMGLAFTMRAEQQRAADLAAYTGAFRAADGSEAAALEEAAWIAALNSPSAPVRLLEPASFPEPEDRAYRALVGRSFDLQIARLAGLGDSLEIEAEAIAVNVVEGPLCMVALDPNGSGIQLSGGTRLTGPDCLIGSNVSLNAPCGTYVTAKTITYRTDVPTAGCNNILTEDGQAVPMKPMTASDPLADHAGINGLAALRLAAGMLEDPDPTNGADLEFKWDGKSPPASGCSATESAPWSGRWVVSCPARDEPYEFGDLILPGGMQLQFAFSGSPGNTYRFSKLEVGGGNLVEFGQGNYEISDGITVAGGGRATFAGGNFRIGAGQDGNALKIGGSTYLGFGAAGTFELGGDIRNEGGGCMMLPSAGTHLVKGSLHATGGVSLGAGVWVFDGVVNLASGGAVNCDGRSVALEAVDAPIVVNGNAERTKGTGECTPYSFCLSAGFNGANISAPVTGEYSGLAVIGPVDVNAGALIGAGASNTIIGGAYYFPNGPLRVTGGASVGDGASCLQFFGAEIELTGSGSSLSNCVGALALVERTRLVR